MKLKKIQIQNGGFFKMVEILSSVILINGNFKMADLCRKSGRDKISARGPHIGPKVHHTDEKLKD
jgi:hypothetical protein